MHRRDASVLWSGWSHASADQIWIGRRKILSLVNSPPSTSMESKQYPISASKALDVPCVEAKKTKSHYMEKHKMRTQSHPYRYEPQFQQIFSFSYKAPISVWWRTIISCLESPFHLAERKNPTSAEMEGWESHDLEFHLFSPILWICQFHWSL